MPFALAGPQKCSGLEVQRYDGPMLAAELGSQFRLLKSEPEIHVSLWGKQQSNSPFNSPIQANLITARRSSL